MAISSNPNEHESHEEPVEALVSGRLKVINWDKRTAQLHRYGGSYVPLRFDANKDDEMRRLQTKFVTVRGQGWISDKDQWIVIDVEEIRRPVAKPFDIDEFRNNPNPKIFDPDKIVRAGEPVDVDEFLRAIYEARGRPQP